MRKLLSLIIAVICLCSVTPAALAAGKVYELPELNMTIEAPEGWIAFTRGFDKNDPNLELLRMDGKGLVDSLIEKNIYLDMFSPDSDYEIFVTMTDYDNQGTYDFNSIPDEDMLPRAESIMQGLQKDMEGQRTYSDCSVYTHKQAKFAVFHFTYQNNGVITYGEQYYTRINGQAINITLFSIGIEISDELAQTLKNTVDSVFFTKVTSKPVPVAPAAAIYELPELNMTIESPEGWIVFTRDIDVNDPNLALLGIDGKELSDYFKENNIYLNIVRKDPLTEIVITMIESDDSRDIYDFNLFPDEDMQSKAESLMRGMQEKLEGKAVLSDCSIYKHKQAVFAVFNLAQNLNGSVIYGKEYSTAINGMIINITLHSFADEISNDLSQTLQNTIDSVTFTKVTQKPFTVILTTVVEIVFAAVFILIIAFIIRKAVKKKKLLTEKSERSAGLENISLK